MPMNYRVAITILACAGVSIAADVGDGLKVALAAKPKIVIFVRVDDELSRSITADQIRNDAELLLRQSNIPVADDNGGAGLFISLRSSRFTLRESSLYAVIPEVVYMENVVPDAVLAPCLLQNTAPEKVFECTRQHLILAELWRNDSVMQLGDNRLQMLRTTLKDLVQKFVLEYLRASDPKK